MPQTNKQTHLTYNMQIHTAIRWAFINGVITSVIHFFSAIYRCSITPFVAPKCTCFPRRGLSFFSRKIRQGYSSKALWHLLESILWNQKPAISQGVMLGGVGWRAIKIALAWFSPSLSWRNKSLFALKGSWLTETGNGFMEAIDSLSNEEAICMEIQYTHETQSH